MTLHKKYQQGKQTRILQVTETPLKTAALKSVVIRDNELYSFYFLFFFFLFLGGDGIMMKWSEEWRHDSK